MHTRVMVNTNPIADIEVYRVESNPGNIHLYRYYVTDEECRHGYLNHNEKDGALVLLKRVLEAVT